MRFLLQSIFLSLFILILASTSTKAHPWGGLVIDAEGNIYFTFICPMVDDDHHYACVWKLNSVNELEEIMKSASSPSDFILTRNTERIIFAAERSGNNPRHRNTLWQINGTSARHLVPPTRDQNAFHIQAYTIRDKTIYFARENEVFVRDSLGIVTQLQLGADLPRIDLMQWSPTGELYIFAQGTIYILDEGNKVRELISGLKKTRPKNLPFSGANIFFDMAIDKNRNVYLAYFGNRKVIKVAPDGSASTFLVSEGRWSPHGIDIFNGEVYVLESTIGRTNPLRFWESNEIVPRVRKVSQQGQVSVLFTYENKN